MDALRIRRARADEGEQLAPILTALSRRSKAHWGYDPELLRRWLEDLSISPGDIDRDVVLVAETGAEPGAEAGAGPGIHTSPTPPRIVGFARVTRGATPVVTTPPPAQLKDLWVEPGDIGTGVGRTLFAAACEVARTLPADQLLIVADPNAEGFYRHMGARRIGEEASEVVDGRRLPILLLDLARPGADAPVTSG
jgi:ribosomal protein S18 acetylase RimI-like enzyme